MNKHFLSWPIHSRQKLKRQLRHIIKECTKCFALSKFKRLTNETDKKMNPNVWFSHFSYLNQWWYFIFGIDRPNSMCYAVAVCGVFIRILFEFHRHICFVSSLPLFLSLAISFEWYNLFRTFYLIRIADGVEDNEMPTHKKIQMPNKWCLNSGFEGYELYHKIIGNDFSRRWFPFVSLSLNKQTGEKNNYQCS